MNSEFAIGLFILIELIFICVLDLKYKKISNYWTILNISLAITFISLKFSAYSPFGNYLIIPFVFLFFSFLLFALKIMGGGDAKLLFSLFLLLPESYQWDFLYILLLTTVIFGLIFLAINLVKRRSLIKMELLMGKGKSVFFKLGSRRPFAPVILIAWIGLLIASFRQT